MTFDTGRSLLWELSELVVEDFFGYTPSKALAITSLILFFLSAVVVAWQTERSQWRYMHTVTVTGLLEAAGYAALLYAIYKSGEANIYGAYVTMQVCVILSPNLLQATMYWTIGNLLAASPQLTRGKRMLGRKAITAAFAGADLLALVVQAIGISIWATAKSSPDGSAEDVKLGSDIMLAGLAFQLFCFILFVFLAIWVHRHPKNALAGTRPLRKLYWGVYLCCAGLLVRNTFRFVEFTQTTVLGWPPAEGVYIIADQEVLFYTLDTLPILLSFAALIVFHCGWYLPPLDGEQQGAGAGAQPGSSDADSLESAKGGAEQQEQQRGSAPLGAVLVTA